MSYVKFSIILKTASEKWDHFIQRSLRDTMWELSFKVTVLKKR